MFQDPCLFMHGHILNTHLSLSIYKYRCSAYILTILIHSQSSYPRDQAQCTICLYTPSKLPCFFDIEDSSSNGGESSADAWDAGSDANRVGSLSQHRAFFIVCREICFLTPLQKGPIDRGSRGSLLAGPLEGFPLEPIGQRLHPSFLGP